MLKYLILFMFIMTFSACKKAKIKSIDQIHNIWILTSAIDKNGEELGEDQKNSKMITDSLYLTAVDFEDDSDWLNNYIERKNRYKLSINPSYFEEHHNNGTLYQLSNKKLTFAYIWCGIMVLEYDIEKLDEDSLILFADSNHEGHEERIRLYYQKLNSSYGEVDGYN